MKNLFYILSAVLLTSLASCTSSKLVINEFTTTGEIYKLKIGMTEAEVITTLGVQPYEIYYNFQDQTKILMWNYRRPNHEVDREKKNTEAVLNVQSSKFVDEEILHVHINDGKLTNFYTDTGRASSKGLINKRFDLSKK